MACATLKRRLELTPHQTPRRADKRRRLYTTSMIIPPTRDTTSPFANCVSPLSTEEIEVKVKEEMRRLKHRGQLNFGDADGGPSSNEPGSPMEKPLLTFGQAGMLYERMLRERDNVLRETYEEVLNAKLAEQYDTFLKFTEEQIQKRFEVTAAPSYLS